MVRSCSLKNCNNSVKQKYRFFILPSVKKVAKRAAWLKKCGHLLPERLPTYGNAISLCEGHFEPDQFVEYGPNIRTILKPTAVPTIFTRNPPRVCDAIESLYDGVIANGVLENRDIESLSLESVNNCIPEFAEEDPSLTSILTENATTDKSKFPRVQLLEIKKNCVVVSTPRGNEIISIAKQAVVEESQVESFFEPASFPDAFNEFEELSSPLLSPPGEEIHLTTEKTPVTIKLHHEPTNSVHAITSSCIKMPAMMKNEREGCIEPITNESQGSDSIVSNNAKQYHEMKVPKNLASQSPRDHHTIAVTNRSELPLRKIEMVPEILQINKEEIKNDLPVIHRIRPSGGSHQVSCSSNGQSIRTYSRLSVDRSDLRKKIHDLEMERDNAMRKYHRLAMKLETFETNLRSFLNDDQIRLLETEFPSLNTMSWTAETLQKSAKIRCIVGPRAYEYLRSHENYPLPSFRTLYRHRDVSKINEYTDEMIKEHMDATINEVAAMGAEDSETSDVEVNNEKEFEAEHIKIEILEESEEENEIEIQEESMFEEIDDTDLRAEDDTTEMEVVQYVTVDALLSPVAAEL